MYGTKGGSPSGTTCHIDSRLTTFYQLDINECENGSNACDQNVSCENDVGSYTCNSLVGYIGDGFE